MANKTNYTILVVPQEEINYTPNSTKRADPPPYNPEIDGPAFDRAWERVAKLKKDGKLSPVPPSREKHKRTPAQ